MKEITHEQALKDLREIAENITSKQWQKLTSKIEFIRNYIIQQEKKDKLLELYRKAHIDVLNGELAEQIKALEEELK